MIPDPPAAVRRSSIDAAIEKLAGFEGAEQISRIQYHGTLDFLDLNRFYLSQEDYNVLNNFVPKLGERMRREDEATVWIVRSAFQPHPSLRPELYYLAE